MEFRGQVGTEHFGISLGMGVLMKMPPMEGEGYFLKSLNFIIRNIRSRKMYT